MALYTATLNNAVRTDINVRVNPRSQFVEQYGLIAAILEAARKTRAFKSAHKNEDAQIVSIVIDGEKVTQF